ncbi:MAG TPA: transposase, partial [Tissierellales bacterium]|nr:transposase [Tissierellales bacterium]
MSTQEARRVTIMDECLKGIRTNKQAAQLLKITERQVQRLKAKARQYGINAVLHGNRGIPPAHALTMEQRKEIADIYAEELKDYNYSHARDVLEEDKAIIVSRSTVSRILKNQGIKSPKSRRPRKNHPSRDARSREGSMAQMDASSYDWLSNDSYLQLHGSIDDATGKVLALHFEQEETTHGYNELVYQMNSRKRLPREFYVDCRTTFRNNVKPLESLSIDEELSGKTNFMTQFQRSMHELGIVL